MKSNFRIFTKFNPLTCKTINCVSLQNNLSTNLVKKFIRNNVAGLAEPEA